MRPDLKDVYEQRAELEYANPPRIDPTVARKFERISTLLLQLTPCESFLDAGCGDGRHLALLGNRAKRLAGVDLSERILETAARTLREAGVDAELRHGALEALPCEDQSFDLALCSQVIEHLPEPEQGIRELARVLRPGGTLIISTDNRRNLVTRALNAPRDGIVSLLRLSGRRRRVHFPHRSFEVDEFVAMVRAGGFAIEHIETFRFHLRTPFDRGVLQRTLNRLEKALPSTRFGDIILVVGKRLETPGREREDSGVRPG